MTVSYKTLVLIILLGLSGYVVPLDWEFETLLADAKTQQQVIETNAMVYDLVQAQVEPELIAKALQMRNRAP